MRTSSTTAHRFREFPVSAGDSWQFVEVDLAFGRFPHHAGLGIRLEEKLPVQRNPPSNLERSIVKYKQINTRGQQNLERLRPTAPEVRSDIDVGRRSRSICRTAAVQIPEDGTFTPQRFDGLSGSCHDVGHVCNCLTARWQRGAWNAART